MDQEKIVLGILALMSTLILAGTSFGALMEKRGQLAVLGEISLGIIISVLATTLGWEAFPRVLNSQTGQAFAQIGICLLLFKIGLETKKDDLQKVGGRAVLIAFLGVAASLLLGGLVAVWAIPHASGLQIALLGGAISSTSVGVASRVFKDLEASDHPAAKAVLSAGIIDDFIGILVLSAVSSMGGEEHASAGMIWGIVIKSIGGLALSFIVGRLCAPFISRLFSSLKPGIQMKQAFALAICFTYSYGAKLIDLSPIVGAFAAGFMLDAVHFENFHRPDAIHLVIEEGGLPEEIVVKLRKAADEHVPELVQNFGWWFTPVFFVSIGAKLTIHTLFKDGGPLTATLLIGAAILGKLACGLGARKGERKIVALGMIARAEVSVVFAETGRRLHLFDDRLFGAIVLTVVVTTALTPLLLNRAMKKAA